MDAGYSPQLLAKYLQNGGMRRVRRGVYRLVHFPAGEHEDLVAFWLWSGREGVFSHTTSLALHDLSDALPDEVHLTLPAAWAHRRLRLPGGVVLHHADLAESERTWAGPVPTTSVARTLADCAGSNVEPRLVRDAFEESCSRGLLDRNSVPGVIEYLKPYFSVSGSASGPRFFARSGQTGASSGVALALRVLRGGGWR